MIKREGGMQRNYGGGGGGGGGGRGGRRLSIEGGGGGGGGASHEMEDAMNGFETSLLRGHWIKGVELALGMLLLLLPLLWLFRPPSPTTTTCILSTFLHTSTAAMGALLIAISCLGLVGALLRRPRLLWAHLSALLLLSLLLFALLLFSLHMTISSTGPASDAFSPFPSWIRHRVLHPNRWRHTVSCLQRLHVCSSPLPPPPPPAAPDPSLFYQTHLSPIQFGCCKPPQSCNYSYVDGKQWNPPSNQTSQHTMDDCALWSNDPSQLCYQCTSCKIGVIQETRSKWKEIRTLLFVVLIVMLTLYAFCGCGLFKTEKPRPIEILAPLHLKHHSKIIFKFVKIHEYSTCMACHFICTSGHHYVTIFLKHT